MTGEMAPAVRRLAMVGVLVGMAAVAVLAAIRFIAQDPEPFPMALGGTALLVAAAGPFLLSAAALSVPRSDVRAGVWLGAGSVAALLSLLGAIGLVSLLLLPGAALLIAAGVRAAERASGAARRVVMGVLVVIVATAVSGVAWSTMSEAHCWYRARDVWVERPFSNAISISDPFTMGVCGSGPTPAGATVSMGAWAVAAAAVAAAGRWRSRAPRPA